MIKHKIHYMIYIIVLAAICLSGCTSTSNSESNSVNQKADTQENSSILSSEQNMGIQENVPDGDGRALVVYFSYSGNTKKLAEAIHNQVGGDLRRIETVEAYPEGDAIYDVSEREAAENARPKYKDLKIDIDNYNQIYIGYPIWAYNMPQVIYSFFDDYDLSGKVIIPFNTHNGAKDAGTYDRIKKLEPNATVLEGLPMMGNSMDKDQSKTIKEWLERIL